MTQVNESLPLRQVRPSVSSNIPEHSEALTLPERKISKPLPEKVEKKPTARGWKPRHYAPEDKPLTKKQKLAVEYLITGRAKTQPDAARMAGYGKWTALAASYDIFGQPHVKKELDRRRREIYSKLEMTSDDIIAELRMLAEANIADFLEIQEDGSFKINLSKATREQLGLLEAIEYDAVGRPKLKLPSRRAVLMDIAKLIGAGERNPQTTDGPLTIQALDAIIANSTTNNITVNINQSSDKKEEVQNYLPEKAILEQEFQPG